MSRVAQHGFEVVDDAATGAHAVAGDYDGRPGSAYQVVEDFLVGGVTVYGDELIERQRPPAGLHAGLGFVVPEVFQLTVGLGEAAGQG